MSQLDRINRDFFWKKSNTEKGLNLIAWDKICRPKVKVALDYGKQKLLIKPSNVS